MPKAKSIVQIILAELEKPSQGIAYKRAAQLANAAPDLLAACEAVMKGDAFDERYRDLCAAAIAQAKGGAK